VVTFLEDDDMYASARLERVKRAFESEPSLIYHHNNVITIDEGGHYLYDPLVERSNVNARVTAHTREEKMAMFERYGWSLGLRNSCIAVRRREFTNMG